MYKVEGNAMKKKDALPNKDTKENMNLNIGDDGWLELIEGHLYTIRKTLTILMILMIVTAIMVGILAYIFLYMFLRPVGII